MRSTIPADSRPAGPGKPTSCQRRAGLTPRFHSRLPRASKPMRHLVMVVAHFAVRIAAAVIRSESRFLALGMIDRLALMSAYLCQINFRRRQVSSPESAKGGEENATSDIFLLLNGLSHGFAKAARTFR